MEHRPDTQAGPQEGGEGTQAPPQAEAAAVPSANQTAAEGGAEDFGAMLDGAACAPYPLQ